MPLATLTTSPTPITPGIKLEANTGKLSFWGRALPDNSHEYYRPVHEWVATYVSQPALTTEVVFKLEYFNTSSTAHFLRMFKKLEEVMNYGSEAVIYWVYEPEDEDMREAGEDFQALTTIPIKIMSTTAYDKE